MTRRMAAVGLAGLAAALLALAAAGLWARAQYVATFAQVHASAARWWTLSREVRIGEPKAEVEAWIHARAPHPYKLVFDPDSRTYFVVVDSIKDRVGLPCSRWYVGVEIGLDADDRVVVRQLITDGVCV